MLHRHTTLRYFSNDSVFPILLQYENYRLVRHGSVGGDVQVKVKFRRELQAMFLSFGAKSG
jgi:hypothetical protein